MRGPKTARKRYLLVRIKSGVTKEVRAEIFRFISSRLPRLRWKDIAWLDDHFVVKTNTQEIEDLRSTLNHSERLPERMVAISTSGSIGKLKSMVSKRDEARNW